MIHARARLAFELAGQGQGYGQSLRPFAMSRGDQSFSHTSARFSFSHNPGNPP